jgi:hypothetical protein
MVFWSHRLNMRRNTLLKVLVIESGMESMGSCRSIISYARARRSQVPQVHVNPERRSVAICAFSSSRLCREPKANATRYKLVDPGATDRSQVQRSFSEIKMVHPTTDRSLDITDRIGEGMRQYTRIRIIRMAIPSASIAKSARSHLTPRWLSY